MQLLSCRKCLLTLVVVAGSWNSGAAQAAFIPWTYNAFYGGTPSYGGYAYSAPAYGYGAAIPTSAYYSPAWSAYRVGYAPMFSTTTVGYGGMSSCGSCGCAPCGCAPCGCSPCGQTGCASGNCGNGNCAGGNCADGNCGAGYTPDINNGPTPEPTRATPESTVPANPPAANPPPATRSTPPEDDFRRVPPTTNDTTIPSTTIPNSTTPMPNPGTYRPNSTIPDTTIPNTNNSPSAPPFEGANDLFRTPVIERTPAPLEPANPAATPGEVLPSDTQLLPAPLEVDSVPVASVRVQRQRIVLQAEYQAIALHRLPVQRNLVISEIELARK